MTIQEVENGKHDNIGKLCVEFAKAAGQLRRIHDAKRDAKAEVENAQRSAEFQRDGQHKAEALREAAARQDKLNAIGKCDREATAQLTRCADDIQKLLGIDFPITLGAAALIEFYEQQLKNDKWRLGPYA